MHTLYSFEQTAYRTKLFFQTVSTFLKPQGKIYQFIFLLVPTPKKKKK